MKHLLIYYTTGTASAKNCDMAPTNVWSFSEEWTSFRAIVYKIEVMAANVGEGVLGRGCNGSYSRGVLRPGEGLHTPTYFANRVVSFTRNSQTFGH